MCGEPPGSSALRGRLKSNDSVFAMTNPWDLIKQQLQLVLSAENFGNWFGRTQFGRIDRGTLYVIVPERQTMLWLESEYAEPIHSLARNLGMGIERVLFTKF